MGDKEVELVTVDYSLDYEMNKTDKILTRGKLKLQREGCVKVRNSLKKQNNLMGRLSISRLESQK